MVKGPNVSIEEITPEKAKAMLAANTGNRKLRENHVAALARDIAAGNWQLNGDAIRFNCDGTLIDGQHRLAAVVKSSTPIQSLVVEGIDIGAKATIDTGAKRSAGDYFGFNGIKDPYGVASACRYAMCMRHAAVTARNYTISELWDFYEDHPGIAMTDFDFKSTKGGMGSVVRACTYIASQTAPHIVEDFTDAWIGGYGPKGSPALVARDRILSAALARNPLSTTYKMRLCAWSLVKMARGATASHVRMPEKIVIPGWANGS